MSAKEIPQCLARPQRHAPAPLMLWPVVQHVAPLTESSEVRIPVVAGVVVAVRGRQDHARHLHQLGRYGGRSRQAAPQVAAPSVTPARRLGIPPAPVA